MAQQLRCVNRSSTQCWRRRQLRGVTEALVERLHDTCASDSWRTNCEWCIHSVMLEFELWEENYLLTFEQDLKIWKWRSAVIKNLSSLAERQGIYTCALSISETHLTDSHDKLSLTDGYAYRLYTTSDRLVNKIVQTRTCKDQGSKNFVL